MTPSPLEHPSLAALRALEQAAARRPSMHGHVIADVAKCARNHLLGEGCDCDACSSSAGATAEGVGGSRGQGGGGGSVPGSPHPAPNFSSAKERGVELPLVITDPVIADRFRELVADGTLGDSSASENLEGKKTCFECGRNLNGYRGSLCRYCDGTAS